VPFCPTCFAEYRVGIAECADCNVALVDELPTAEEDAEPERAAYRPPPPTGNDVAIARDESMAIVQMWAELLGEEQIACRIVPARVGDTGLVPGQALWELRVAAIDAQRALELLPGDGPEEAEPESEPGEAQLEAELTAEVADAEGQARAMRWFVVAGVIFVVLIAWVILAQVGR
jgi:hypothetical protein